MRSSPFSALRTTGKRATFATQADVRNAVTGATLNEIDYELNRMCTTGPNDTEMTQAERYLVGNEAIDCSQAAAWPESLPAFGWTDCRPTDIAKESERIDKRPQPTLTVTVKKYFPAAAPR